MRRMTRGICLVLLGVAMAGPASSPATACTAFCFDTPEGPVFGANLDLRWRDGLVFVNRRGLAKTGYMWNSLDEPIRWTATYGSVSFNLVGIEMPWGGMNEAGLAASSMQLLVTEYPEADERYPVSSATWLQIMLDTCTTVGDVIAAQDSLRLRGDAVHFLVADASGDCVIIETLGGETAVHAGEDLPVRALANATYRDCLAYLETGARPAFNPGRSAERVAAAVEWSERYDPAEGISGSDWALQILTEACVDPKAWWKVLFRSPFTRWSLAFDIARREIRFRTTDHEPVRSLDLAKLDFDCGAPVLMMDVNAELEGPIEDAFQPYDSEWNHEEARRFLKRWGTVLDEEEIRWLTGFLESFPCAP